MVDIKTNPREVWALPYTGIPALLSNISIISFAVGVLFALLGSTIQFFFFPILGFLTAFLSLGNGVEIKDNTIILKYGFPTALFKIKVSDIVGVFNVNELKKGKLVKYFKTQLTPFILIIILPPAYTIAKGRPVNPVYIPWIILPSVIGMFLMLYFMFTAETYRKLLRRISQTICTSLGLLAFIISIVYCNVYGISIFSDPHVVILALIGIVLLGLSSAVLVLLVGKRPIIVLEDSMGRFYAVGAVNKETAEHFIKLVLKEVMGNVETTA